MPRSFTHSFSCSLGPSLAALLVLCGLGAGCGSSAAPANSVDAGPPAHRAQAVECPATTNNSVVTVADGGGVACTMDTDCQADGGNPFAYCLQNACGADQCLTDDDCAGGAVCLCASEAGGGLVIRQNRCVPSTCRIDSDCGAGELCSTGYGYCGTPTGFHCRSAADTCRTNADCAGKGTASSCNYAPTVGHWQCMAPQVCLG
jgi:Cys-rich repeat protein